MPSVLRIGCKVSAAVGPFKELQPGARRRTRENFTGTIIKSDENRQFTVYWYNFNKAATHSSNSLRFESNGEQNIGSSEILSILANHYVINQAGLDMLTHSQTRRQQAS